MRAVIRSTSYTECVSWPQSIFVAVIAMLILYHLHAFSIASRPVADTSTT
jgi:hypothetical protein